MPKLLEKVNFKTLFWVFFYFFIFCLLLRNSFSYLDADFGWHLKVGQEIVNTQTVPRINHYNYTFSGDWVDHEWLSNAILYETYNYGGYIFVSILFALIVIFVLILLNVAARRFLSETSDLLIALLQFFGLVASLPHLGVRLQEFGVLFLLLLLIIIVYYNKNKNWRTLLFLPPLMYLWACVHASFLIGFFLLAAWLFIKIGENLGQKFWPKSWLDFSGVLEWREIIIFAVMLIFSFGATLLTPYKLGLYSFLLGYQNTFYQSNIQEWLSQFSFPLQYWQLFYLALAALALIFYIYYARKQKPSLKINLWTIFLVLLFVFLGFKSRRHIPLMFIVSFLFLVDVWRIVLKTDPPVKIGRPNKYLYFWLKVYLLCCLLVASAHQLAQVRFTNEPFSGYCEKYPCGAVEFLKDHPGYDSFNIFNEYGWGGYLIWAYPEKKLFIDGRLPQVPFAGQTFLEEYYDFYKKDHDIAKKLNQYQIKLVLIPAEDRDLKIKKWEKIFFGIKDGELVAHNDLRDYLSSSSDWQPVYRDAIAVIYKK
ncbi:MAG: hypothetical protein WC249_00150 [Patescibacteria group bacterium]|jgi:hypothetical protein